MINVDVERANLIGIEFSVAEQRIVRKRHNDQPLGICYLDTEKYFMDITRGGAQFVDMSTYHRAILNRYGNRVSPEDKQALTQLMEQIASGERLTLGFRHMELVGENGLALLFTPDYDGRIEPRSTVGWAIVGPSWKEILIKDGAIKPNG